MGRKRLLKLADILHSLDEVENKIAAINLYKKSGPSWWPFGKKDPTDAPPIPGKFTSSNVPPKDLDAPTSLNFPPIGKTIAVGDFENPEEPEVKVTQTKSTSNFLPTLNSLQEIIKLENLLTTISDEAEALSETINTSISSVNGFLGRYKSIKPDISREMNAKFNEIKQLIEESEGIKTFSIAARLKKLKTEILPKIPGIKSNLEKELSEAENEYKISPDQETAKDIEYLKGQLDIIESWEIARSQFSSSKKAARNKRFEKIASLLD
jgi:hypothetical protein